MPRPNVEIRIHVRPYGWAGMGLHLGTSARGDNRFLGSNSSVTTQRDGRRFGQGGGPSHGTLSLVRKVIL